MFILNVIVFEYIGVIPNVIGSLSQLSFLSIAINYLNGI